MDTRIEYCSRTGDHSKYGFTDVGQSGSQWWVCAKPGCGLPTRKYVESINDKDRNEVELWVMRTG